MKRHYKLKCNALHVYLFTMRKQASIRNGFLHLAGKKRKAQRGGFIAPLLVNGGKTTIGSLFGSGNKIKIKIKIRRRRQ